MTDVFEFRGSEEEEEAIPSTKTTKKRGRPTKKSSSATTPTHTSRVSSSSSSASKSANKPSASSKKRSARDDDADYQPNSTTKSKKSKSTTLKPQQASAKTSAAARTPASSSSTGRKETHNTSAKQHSTPAASSDEVSTEEEEEDTGKDSIVRRRPYPVGKVFVPSDSRPTSPREVGPGIEVTGPEKRRQQRKKEDQRKAEEERTKLQANQFGANSAKAANTHTNDSKQAQEESPANRSKRGEIGKSNIRQQDQSNNKSKSSAHKSSLQAKQAATSHGRAQAGAVEQQDDSPLDSPSSSTSSLSTTSSASGTSSLSTTSSATSAGVVDLVSNYSYARRHTLGSLDRLAFQRLGRILEPNSGIAIGVGSTNINRYSEENGQDAEKNNIGAKEVAQKGKSNWKETTEEDQHKPNALDRAKMSKAPAKRKRQATAEDQEEPPQETAEKEQERRGNQSIELEEDKESKEQDEGLQPTLNLPHNDIAANEVQQVEKEIGPFVSEPAELNAHRKTTEEEDNREEDLDEPQDKPKCEQDAIAMPLDKPAADTLHPSNGESTEDQGKPGDDKTVYHANTKASLTHLAQMVDINTAIHTNHAEARNADELQQEKHQQDQQHDGASEYVEGSLPGVSSRTLQIGRSAAKKQKHSQQDDESNNVLTTASSSFAIFEPKKQRLLREFDEVLKGFCSAEDQIQFSIQHAQQQCAMLLRKNDEVAALVAKEDKQFDSESTQKFVSKMQQHLRAARLIGQNNGARAVAALRQMVNRLDSFCQQLINDAMQSHSEHSAATEQEVLNIIKRSNYNAANKLGRAMLDTVKELLEQPQL